MANILRVNNVEYSVSGNNISIKNGGIYVGDDFVCEAKGGLVKVEFIGDLASLACNDAVINGDVKGNVTGNDIKVKGSVGGGISGNEVTIGGNATGRITACEVNVKGGIKM